LQTWERRNARRKIYGAPAWLPQPQLLAPPEVARRKAQKAQSKELFSRVADLPFIPQVAIGPPAEKRRRKCCTASVSGGKYCLFARLRSTTIYIVRISAVMP
jgi:hypothetical protein